MAPRPRLPAEPGAAIYPVTAEEVREMFAKAMKRKPPPDRETCGHMARLLSGFIRHPSKDVADVWFGTPVPPLHPVTPAALKRRRDAINLLRKAMREDAENSLQPGWRAPGFEDLTSLDRLAAALDAAESVLCGVTAVPRGHRPWYVSACVIAGCALSVMQEQGSRAKAVGRQTMAAHFTELALQRIGFHDVEREAVARFCEKWGVE